jgi:hypothetical protein
MQFSLSYQEITSDMYRFQMMLPGNVSYVDMLVSIMHISFNFYINFIADLILNFN